MIEVSQHKQQELLLAHSLTKPYLFLYHYFVPFLVKCVDFLKKIIII